MSYQKNADLLNEFVEKVKGNPFLNGFIKNDSTYESLPIMDKTVLRQLIADNFKLQEEEKGVYLQRTGGTMSESLLIPVDPFENYKQRDILVAKLKAESLIEPRDICINLFNYKHLYRSASLLDYIIEHCEATSVGLGAITPDEFVYNFAVTLHANTLVGTPTRVLQFANYVLENGLNIKFRKFIFGGEVLTNQFLQTIKEVFGIEKIIGLYGAMEIGTFAYTDYLAYPGKYKLLDDLILVDVENPDELGFGNILITNKVKERFPVLKYRLGDVGRVYKENNETWFEWKKRGEYGFRLLQVYIFEEMLNPILNEFARYQIKISFNDLGKSKLEFLITPYQDKMVDFKKLEADLRVILTISKSEYELILIKAEHHDYFVNPVSQKSPLLIDHRNKVIV
jgi:phenylacetate-CoA ligase